MARTRQLTIQCFIFSLITLHFKIKPSKLQPRLGRSRIELTTISPNIRTSYRCVYSIEPKKADHAMYSWPCA